jgi:rhamnosyltransferase
MLHTTPTTPDRTSNTIAIVLSTYNGAKYIAEQLDAVLSQTYTDWRCYMRDDGSKDNTADILKEYAKKDNRFIYLDDQKSNMGYNATYYYLFGLVNENYIAACDQDDVWLPNKLAVNLQQIQAIETSQKIPALVHSDSFFVDSNLNIIREYFIGKRGLKPGLSGILFANCAQGGSLLLNKSLRDIALTVPPVLPCDYHLALIADMVGARAFIPERLLKYRQHSASIIATGSASSKANRQQQPTVNNTIGSLQVSFSLYHRIKQDFRNLRPAAHIQAELDEYCYLFEGSNRLKKLWIVLKNRYAFYRRKDELTFIYLLLFNHNLLAYTKG